MCATDRSLRVVFCHEEVFSLSIPFWIAPTVCGGSASSSPASPHNFKHVSRSRGQYSIGLLLSFFPEAKTVLTVYPSMLICDWERCFFPQGEKSWGEVSASTAALQRSERNSTTLNFNGKREYPLKFVGGVQNRLRKDRLIFQRQRRPWICWWMLLRGKSIHQD